MVISLIIAGFLAMTPVQTRVPARQPLQNLLKNKLHLDRRSDAAFIFWAAMAWYLKLFAGILTDAFPAGPQLNSADRRAVDGSAGPVGAE